MKLQELLNKHKDNLRKEFTIKSIMLCNTDWKKDKFHLAIDIWFTIVYKSISDLLFSTPFLSLLERVKSPNEILVRTEFEWLISPLWCNEEWQQIRCYWNTYQYHKINLVLLNTDAERIEYIEKFTI